MDRSELYNLETQGDKPTGQLSPQGWLMAPELDSVFGALEVGGAEVRFVGGCVRDGLANRSVHDVDIATTCLPQQTMDLLQQANIRAVPTGLDHGTITAVLNDCTYQITTLRKDVATDGRHAAVAFTDSWFADARRRDFTINALSATRDGAVYDPYNGISDLSRGRIVFIGNAAERIAEDHLRILRYFRFQATHGAPPPDRGALMACRLAAKKIAMLSGERIRDEMIKILSAANSADTILLMRGETVLDQVLPEALEVGRLRTLTWLTTRAIQMDAIFPDPLRNLAALLPVAHNSSAAADAVADRWRLSNENRKRLQHMAIPLGVDPEASESERKKYLYEHGGEMTTDRALLAWAGEVSQQAHLPRKRTESWICLLEMAGRWAKPPFPLSGEDIIALGVPAGPQVGQVLNDVEAWWAANSFMADFEECLTQARNAVNAQSD